MVELKKKLDEAEKQHEVISARLFSLERFTSDADINFYTGLPNYATFLALFNFWILVNMEKIFVQEAP